MNIEQFYPLTSNSDGARVSVDLADSGGANPAPAEPATPSEESVAIHGDQNADKEELNTQAGQTRAIDEPVSVSGDQTNAEQVKTTQIRQTATSEELVTIPLTKLQQLVEFCAQVLQESKSRELPSIDLEKGTRTSALANHSISLTMKMADDISLSEGFEVYGRYSKFRATISPEVSFKIKQLWSGVKAYKTEDSLGTEQSDLVEWAQQDHHSISDLARLFDDDHKFVDDAHAPLGTVFIHIMSSNASRAIFEFDTRLLALVCVYGAQKYCLGGILAGCYACGVLERPQPTDSRGHAEQILQVVQYSLLFNRMSSYRNVPGNVGYAALNWHDKDPPSLGHLLGLLLQGRSLSHALGLTLDQVFCMLHYFDRSVAFDAANCAEGAGLRVDDLNVRSIHTLGGLRIVWTLIMEEHLLLDMKNMILYVLWQLPIVSKNSAMGRWDIL
ncbi:MAG: hypothetical protein CL912_09945 [Deltaproteobacteria bacterium]|nr:hypothetical protein [Deltaproteobacteria bacterium]